MTEYVYSTKLGEAPPHDEWATAALYPVTRERPCWLKHVRVYEWAPRLHDHEAYAVLADALELANRDTVDEVIRDAGIGGCWRPSTLLVHQLIDHGTNRVIIGEQTIAHALWNTDLHVSAQRGSPFSMRLVNDENRKRHARVTFHLVELTDEELNPNVTGSIAQRFAAIENRIRSIEGAVTVLGKWAKMAGGVVFQSILDDTLKPKRPEKTR